MPDSTYRTPGDWRVESGSIVSSAGVSIGGADRDESRTVPCERDRNVDLMAAAPALLRELMYCADRMPTDTQGDIEAHTRIRLIIRKAQGKDRP